MFFRGLDDVKQHLENIYTLEEAMILIKGSRGMTLEALLELF
jgi:UDP-N-acetylmuramyl pentapeptide synthase